MKEQLVTSLDRTNDVKDTAAVNQISDKTEEGLNIMVKSWRNLRYDASISC